MTSISNPKYATKLLATGLLILSGSQLLSHFVKIPDFIVGACMGLGIGLEIMALVMIRKMRGAK